MTSALLLFTQVALLIGGIWCLMSFYFKDRFGE